MNAGLIIRRRIMAMQKEVLRDDYVADGLILWMDGIDKGGTTNHWIDKVSSIDFVGDTSTAPTASSNCFEFDGSQYFYNTAFTPPAAASGTIEVVFETASLSANQMVFMPKTGASRLALYFNTAGRMYMTGAGSTSRKTYNSSISVNTKMYYSLNASSGYLNGAALTANSNSYMGGANSYNYIGKRRAQGAADGNNFFTGKIYSIRLYSRQLSAEEVAHNYDVDRSRFKF